MADRRRRRTELVLPRSRDHRARRYIGMRRERREKEIMNRERERKDVDGRIEVRRRVVPSTDSPKR